MFRSSSKVGVPAVGPSPRRLYDFRSESLSRGFLPVARHLRRFGLALLGALVGAGSLVAPVQAAPLCVSGLSLSTVVTAGGASGYSCNLGVVTYIFKNNLAEISEAGGRVVFTDGGLMATRDPDDNSRWYYNLTQTIRLENLDFAVPMEEAAWLYELFVNKPGGTPGPSNFMPTRSVTAVFDYTTIGSPRWDPLLKDTSGWDTVDYFGVETSWKPSFSVIDSPTAQGLDYNTALDLAGGAGERVRTDQRLDSVSYILTFRGGSSSELYPGATIVPDSSAVPEPETVWLSLLSLGALLAARRRIASGSALG
jgi:hypothetical protein